jgi:hypothetical protein
MTWMEAADGRDTWREDLVLLDFRTTAGCAYWILLSITGRVVMTLLFGGGKAGDEDEEEPSACWKTLGN